MQSAFVLKVLVVGWLVVLLFGGFVVYARLFRGFPGWDCWLLLDLLCYLLLLGSNLVCDNFVGNVVFVLDLSGLFCGLELYFGTFGV